MLTIIRGMPGSGKSTLGRKLAAEQNALFVEPDMMMYRNGIYKYDPSAFTTAVFAARGILLSYFIANPDAHAVYADVLPQRSDVTYLAAWLNFPDYKVIDMPLIDVATSRIRNVHNVRLEDLQWMYEKWESWKQ